MSGKMSQLEALANMNQDYVRDNVELINDELMTTFRNYNADPAEPVDYSDAICWAAFWLAVGLGLLGAGLGGAWK